MQDTKRMGLVMRTFAAFMTLALVMCVAIGFHASPAYAVGNNVDVALTVVDTTDGTVLANTKVSFLSDESTVADLLKIAGFSEISSAADYQRLDQYYVSYGVSPIFMGKDYDPETGYYWVTMFNGTGAYPECGNAYVTAKLQDGAHYQFVYAADQYPDPTTFSYDAKVKDPMPTASPMAKLGLSPYAFITSIMKTDYSGINSGKISVYNESLSAATAFLGLVAYEGYQQSGAFSVLNPTANVELQSNYAKGLQKRFANITAKDLELLGADYAVAALALAASGMELYIDRQALIDVYLDNPNISAGRLAKVILGLNAAGVDCTAASINGETVDLAAEMMSKSINDNGEINSDLYSLVWIVPAVNATYPSETEEFVDALKKKQTEDGTFAEKSQADPQTASQAILALATVGALDEASTAAIQSIMSYQKSNGGFSYTNSDTAGADVDTTGAVMAALAATGDERVTYATKSMASAKLTLSYTGTTYSGSPKKPTPTVKVGTKTLKKGIDYAAEYKGNLNAGKASVKIKGIGAYSGSISKTFAINKKAQSLTVSTASKTAYYKDTKLDAVYTTPVKVTGAKGTLSFTKKSGSSKLSVDKASGQIKVKMGTKKGTYYIKVKCYSSSTVNYKSAYKYRTVKVRVK